MLRGRDGGLLSRWCPKRARPPGGSEFRRLLVPPGSTSRFAGGGGQNDDPVLATRHQGEPRPAPLSSDPLPRRAGWKTLPGQPPHPRAGRTLHTRGRLVACCSPDPEAWQRLPRHTHPRCPLRGRLLKTGPGQRFCCNKVSKKICFADFPGLLMKLLELA